MFTLLRTRTLPVAIYAATFDVLFTYLIFEIALLTVSVNKQETVSTKHGASGHFALQIAAKPLQIATRLLLTAYRNLPTPYPTVPSPTPYDPYRLATLHTLQTTDRRTTPRTISATVCTVG